jgi:DNA-nicking Smr family endonuclease
MTIKTPKDAHLWQEVVKTVKPLNRRSLRFDPSFFQGAPSPSQIQTIRLREYVEQHQLSFPSEVPSPIQAKRLHKVGKVRLEARLDLHGQTRQEAQARLQKFVALAHYDRVAWILVITGKGDPNKPYTLKKLLPQWLDLMPLVTGYAAAKDQHGGQGAYYVRIKGHTRIFT